MICSNVEELCDEAMNLNPPKLHRRHFKTNIFKGFNFGVMKGVNKTSYMIS